MVDNVFGDFFLSDVDDEMLEEDDDLIAAPVTVPVQPATPASDASTPAPAAPAAAPVLTPVAAPQPLAGLQAAPPMASPSAAEPVRASAPATTPVVESREDRLVATLNKLMDESREIQASALVSLDGFTMASALPENMQEDRVGAMSAAILGLGERAAVELGRGSLSQVIIEGEGGYVMLISAGERAALTCLADADAKLGLVLYDMRSAAQVIAEILG